jgi:signal peptidase II
VQAGRGAEVREPTRGPRQWPRQWPRWWAVAITVVVAGLDQLTKLAVVSTLQEGESQRVWDDILRLSHFRNSGAAFGLLRGFGGLFALAALVGVIAFVMVLVRRPAPSMALAAALVSGGALGNLLDRLFRGPIGRGTVVDFVDVRFWPAFNLADSAITIGALLLIATGLWDRPKQSRTPDG